MKTSQSIENKIKRLNEEIEDYKGYISDYYSVIEKAARAGELQRIELFVRNIHDDEDEIKMNKEKIETLLYVLDKD